MTVRDLPYKHSPEEGTQEADEQPWTIHVPLAGVDYADFSDEPEEDEVEVDEERPRGG
jgi:hypothetical protein